jgi:hypothetical protein
VRNFHIWAKNNKTNEVKCKLVKVNSFANAAQAGYMFIDALKQKTRNEWHIMSINDTNFSHDPKALIV